MASNDSRQAEYQETYINLSVDEARPLVMAQIERCKDLLKTPPKTKDGLRTARNQYKKWRKYTATLLYPKIFSTKELAEQFAPIFDQFGWAGAPDTPRALQYDLNRGLVRLESIYECLGLYPEKPRQPAPAAKADVLYQREPPPEPKSSASPDDWFDWFHCVKDEFGYRINLNDLATKLGYSHSYLRHLHSEYKKKRTKETTQKTTQK